MGEAAQGRSNKGEVASTNPCARRLRIVVTINYQARRLLIFHFVLHVVYYFGIAHLTGAASRTLSCTTPDPVHERCCARHHIYFDDILSINVPNCIVKHLYILFFCQIYNPATKYIIVEPDCVCD
jgi:hypothetical protein